MNGMSKMPILGSKLVSTPGPPKVKSRLPSCSPSPRPPSVPSWLPPPALLPALPRREDLALERAVGARFDRVGEVGDAVGPRTGRRPDRAEAQRTRLRLGDREGA